GEGIGLRVVITDTAGRIIERHVANAAVASTVIESWARSDIEDALLAPVLDDVLSAPPLQQAAEEPSARARVPQPRSGLEVSAEIASELLLADDGSGWYGMRAATCVRF